MVKKVLNVHASLVKVTCTYLKANNNDEMFANFPSTYELFLPSPLFEHTKRINKYTWYSK